MKKSLFLSRIFGILCFLLVSICQAQWQPDVRLTNDAYASNTSLNNAWCVAASGDVVHVVWHDDRYGNDEIFYKRSTDAGSSWEADTWLTDDPSSSYNPSVSVFGSVVHVVWSDGRDDSNFEIFYKRSTDGGSSWGTDTRLTNDFAVSWVPSVSVSGSDVHVVWEDTRDVQAEIYYTRSTDGGTSWGGETRLSDIPVASKTPSVSVSGSVVHVVWEDYREGNANREIYYKLSTDGGTSWGTDTRLTYDPAVSNHPSVSVSGSDVHVVWEDDRDVEPEIYYKRSIDGGISWGSDTRLTNISSYSRRYPSVSASGSAVHVVWEDTRNNGNAEIYYNRSTDGGTSWGSDTRLTNNTAYSRKNSSVSASGSDVHVVWMDLRGGNGNWEIFYKRDPTGNPTGIKNISSEIPEEFSLSQNYPNPFNPKSNINFSTPKSASVKLTVFDILGREIATLANENLKPGAYRVDFDGTNYPSGVYFYTLIAGEFSQTKKMVLTK